jgi:hypothetical protein
MRLQPRSYSRVTLENLLKKRKKTMEEFMNELGIVSYESLKNKCENMGVQPPSEQEFMNATGNSALPKYSSPAEGIVVLLPIEKEEPATKNDIESETSSLASQKKKKKNDTSSAQ